MAPMALLLSLLLIGLTGRTWAQLSVEGSVSTNFSASPNSSNVSVPPYGPNGFHPYLPHHWNHTHNNTASNSSSHPWYHYPGDWRWGRPVPIGRIDPHVGHMNNSRLPTRRPMHMPPANWTLWHPIKGIHSWHKGNWINGTLPGHRVRPSTWRHSYPRLPHRLSVNASTSSKWNKNIHQENHSGQIRKEIQLTSDSFGSSPEGEYSSDSGNSGSGESGSSGDVSE